MAVFTSPYPPDYGVSVRKKFRMVKTNFGDGYVQNVSDGLNTAAEEWNLSWDMLTADQTKNIQDQLDSFKGQIFTWVTPRGQTKPFTCEEYSVTYDNYESYSVSATFQESFDLS
jgi:phage-related protein